MWTKYEILKGQISISSLKEVEIEDLLGRPPVTLDLNEVPAYLENQVIMVPEQGVQLVVSCVARLLS